MVHHWPVSHVLFVDTTHINENGLHRSITFIQLLTTTKVTIRHTHAETVSEPSSSCVNEISKPKVSQNGLIIQELLSVLFRYNKGPSRNIFRRHCSSRVYKTWGIDGWSCAHKYFKPFRARKTNRNDVVSTEIENYSQLLPDVKRRFILRQKCFPNKSTLFSRRRYFIRRKLHAWGWTTSLGKVTYSDHSPSRGSLLSDCLCCPTGTYYS